MGMHTVNNILSCYRNTKEFDVPHNWKEFLRLSPEQRQLLKDRSPLTFEMLLRQATNSASLW